MKQFNFAEDVVSTEITVTDGFGDGAAPVQVTITVQVNNTVDSGTVGDS